MRNHYVPQFVIKEFADRSGMVAVYDKNRGTIRKSSPKDVFVIKDFYSDETEKALAEKEGIISGIVKQILDACRGNAKPTLRDTEVLAGCRYLVLLQLARSPYARNVGVDGLELDMEDSLDKDLEAEGLDLSDEVVRKRVEDAKKRALNDAKAKRKSKVWSNSVDNFLRNPALALPDVVKAIKGKGVILARTKSSFVLGDRGSMSTAGGGQHLDHPTREIFLPVAPDVAVSLGGDRNQVLVATLDATATRKINLSTVRHNDVIVSRSARLLRSLSDPR